MKKSKKLLLTSLCGLAAVGIYACGSTGRQGEPGAAGAKGDGCSVVTNADGTATIKCTDGSSFDIKNGQDGNPGDAGSDGKDGQNGKSCYLTENIDGSAAVVCPADGSSFIVRGNTDNYANYCKKGFWGKNCENECNCNEHQDCNDGVTGDGSCSCKDNWDGQNCDECADGYTGLQCVRITCNTANGILNEENGKCSTCNYGWTGDNCDICQANWDNSKEGKCARCDSNHYGVICGNTYGLVEDTVNGTSYKTVQIGNQIWMAENLKATKDRDGNEVNCYANTDADSDFVNKFGCFYIWEELATLNGETKAEYADRICPTGWHLPTYQDFEELISYVDANRTSENSFLALIAKSPLWSEYPNMGGDEFGFRALPAGEYAFSKVKYYFNNFGLNGYFWSATPNEQNNEYVYFLYIKYNGFGLGGGGYLKNGRSVRCIKN